MISESQSIEQPSTSPESSPTWTRATGGIFVLFAIAGVLLLWQLPDQAAWVKTKRGWYTQPMMGPALGLGVFVLFAVLKVFQHLRRFHLHPLKALDSGADAVASYRVAIIASALFALYIHSLSIMGFVPATWLFVLTLLWVSRLLNGFWILTSLVSVAAVVLIFRVMLNLWLPDVWLYGLLPEEWSLFANQYL